MAQGFGALGPDIYGGLVNSHRGLFIAYLIGGGVMLLGGTAELIFGIAAERRSLEDIATPLSAVDQFDGGAATGARTGFAHGTPPGSAYPPRPKQ
jgi:hypothetical protein